jgi:hypothetical protein
LAASIEGADGDAVGCAPTVSDARKAHKNNNSFFIRFFSFNIDFVVFCQWLFSPQK